MSISIDAYRSVSQGTASPRQTIIRLYEAGGRFLGEAEETLAAGESAHEPLAKARTIVSGLMTSLDFEAGELAHRLLGLYLFAMDRIQATAAAGTDQGLAEARAVLDVLRSAWEEMPAEEARRGLGARRPSGLDLKG